MIREVQTRGVSKVLFSGPKYLIQESQFVDKYTNNDSTS